MRPIILYLAILGMASLMMVACAGGSEVALCFEKAFARQLQTANLDEFNGSVVVDIPVSSISPCNMVIDKSRSLSMIREEISSKVNSDNRSIRTESLELIGTIPGDRSIARICAIYDCVAGKGNWNYVSDVKLRDDFQFSNYSLELGQKDGLLGKGDCDDFAILLAGLIEAIGATSRIIIAYGQDGAHAYTEVYLGNDSIYSGNVSRMIRWLQYNYNINNIYCHRDDESGDVWLNLDWQVDKESNSSTGEITRHPGGPFYPAETQVAVYPDSRLAKLPLIQVLMLPVAIIRTGTEIPTRGENILFDASKSYDIDGNISSYQWFFEDEPLEGETVNRTFSQSEPVHVRLLVTDDQGLKGLNSTSIRLNEPPIPEFSYEPNIPSVNDTVNFDAGESRDPDGQISEYHWEYGNEDTGTGAKKTQSFSRRGIYNVNLTVKDSNGSVRSIVHPIIVSGAEITNLNEGDYASQEFDLIGDYYPYNDNKYIWIFVKDHDKRYYPQTTDHCNPKNASIRDGKWECRIGLGDLNDADKFYEIIVTQADEATDELIREGAREWLCSGSEENAPEGFDLLPDGAVKTDWIKVVRSNEIWNCSQDISDIEIAGNVSISYLAGGYGNTYPGLSNNSVDESVMVFGSRSPDTIDAIWVLVHSKNGRWYPQSIDNDDDDLEHVTNAETLMTHWNIPAVFSGEPGSIYDLVVVLANSSADDFFNDFQRDCARARNADGTMGNYTGLLTIDLPHGIDEKFRMRVQRNGHVNGKMKLATASYDKSVRIWDAQTGAELHRMMHEGEVQSVDFSPDGRLVASASSDKSVRIWDANTGRQLLNLSHNSQVISVKFSNDGLRVDTTCIDGRNYTWDLEIGELLRQSERDIRLKAVFSEDDSHRAVAVDDNYGLIMNMRTGSITKLEYQDGSVFAIAFSPDSRMLATAGGSGNNGTANIWDVSTGMELFSLPHSRVVMSLAFSPDGRQIVTACLDGNARIWDLESRQLFRTMHHDSWVTAVAFSPDGKLIATGSRDHAARIWDAETGEELFRLPHDDWVSSVDFGPSS